MGLFTVYWQHEYKGKLSTHEVIREFNEIPELNLNDTEAAERYAKSLSCGDFSVKRITKQKGVN